MSIKSFTKIFSIGHREIPNLFAGPVEITEKVDGSQFAFGVIDGKFLCRSKNVVIEYCPPESDMFYPAYLYALSLYESDLLVNDTVYYCEYLRKPKHNTLAYERVPRNNLCLFGVADANGINYTFESVHGRLELIADRLDIDVVPVLYSGEVKDAAAFEGLLLRKSFLGGADIEGVVVKNYNQPSIVGGVYLPISCGKYVSEQFKEKHQATWKYENTSGGALEVLKAKYRSEARWKKAIHALRDQGLLLNDPKDIGPLLKYINTDLLEEEKDEIAADLYKIYGKDIVKAATRGFPEWYKQTLLESAFAAEPCEVVECGLWVDSKEHG